MFILLDFLVVVVLPLASITEDQVVWLRSIRFEAAFIGECEASDKELLGGRKKVFRSPKVRVEERFMKMFAICL